MKQILIAICLLLAIAGCEDTDLRLAAEAGLDAVTAITLSDEAVSKLPGLSWGGRTTDECPVFSAGGKRGRRLWPGFFEKQRLAKLYDKLTAFF